MASDCLFCNIVAGTQPADVIYSTERSVAFRDINPQAPLHVLVVPRAHIENASTVQAEHAQDVADLFVAARAVADQEGLATTDRGYRLVLNVGPDALSSVPHLHVHLLGGRPMGWPPG